MKQVFPEKEVDMLFFMLTNIFTETTELLFYGKDADKLMTQAFPKAEISETSVILPQVVSRKKQVIPKIMNAAQA